MKILLTILLTAVFLITACNSEEEIEKDNSTTEEAKKEAHIAMVVDKINANNYTYLQVSENKKNYWIAVSQMEIEIGETVYFSKYMEMKDFKSETIDRTFNSLLFVEDARKSATPDHMKQVHSGAMTISKQNVKVEPLDDGYTIKQIYAEKKDLEDKVIEVKGKVVKFNPQIMNRNWIHIQDGTGAENDYDLVVTSADQVKVGDVIIVEGAVIIDKDFGAGYFFPVIIEDARIKTD
ncbi:MAG: hypothetical protein HKP17_09610 [Ignavibacteriaceae bacterium]|nr:hypothetical protein [Ignavibacteria bacterium]MBT8390747.1 hypothetical protein [Ignavibacteria bacterium]NNJ53416.1 hypothetical protein [Ignavibacteriaceae bacterium]NNL22409.1 hypothetical protein [Ignavibacteriaceae bacterium]